MPDARGGFGSENRKRIMMACEKHWDKYKGDCSAFVKAVAADLGVTLNQPANDMYNQIQQSPWEVIGRGSHASVIAGITAAQDGKFVVGAWRSRNGGHGHVAIIVDYRGTWYADPRIRNRSVGYWGQLGGEGKKYSRTDRESWGSDKLEDVLYSCIAIS